MKTIATTNVHQRFVDLHCSLSLHRTGVLPQYGFSYGDGKPENEHLPGMNIGLAKLIERATKHSKTFNVDYSITEILDARTSQLLVKVTKGIAVISEHGF